MNQSDRQIIQLSAPKCAPHRIHRLAWKDGLIVAHGCALALFLSGCASPSPESSPKFFVTGSWSTYGPSLKPDPWNRFIYGEHIFVVVEGFPNVYQAVLEISTNGVYACNQKFTLDPNYAGTKVDLGCYPAADYTINLKTNGAVAGTIAFTVFLPDALEKQREHLEAERSDIQQESDQIQKLHDEIEDELSTLDHSNSNAVAAYNFKVMEHNERVLKNNADKTQFNASVTDFNQQMEKLQSQTPMSGTLQWRSSMDMPMFQ